jgi:hypothetical protein
MPPSAGSEVKVRDRLSISMRAEDCAVVNLGLCVVLEYSTAAECRNLGRWHLAEHPDFASSPRYRQLAGSMNISGRNHSRDRLRVNLIESMNHIY